MILPLADARWRHTTWYPGVQWYLGVLRGASNVGSPIFIKDLQYPAFWARYRCVPMAMKGLDYIYLPYFSVSQDKVTVYHHWREGNLPPNSRCLVCKKSCATHECLASMKCEWCWATVSQIILKTSLENCHKWWLNYVFVWLNRCSGNYTARIMLIMNMQEHFKQHFFHDN